MRPRMWRKRNPITTWQECKPVQLLWRFLKNLRAKQPSDPDISLLGIELKDCKSICHRDVCTVMLLLHQSCVDMDGWMHALMCTCVHFYVLVRVQPWMSFLRCLPPFAARSLTALGLDWAPGTIQGAVRELARQGKESWGRAVERGLRTKQNMQV